MRRLVFLFFPLLSIAGCSGDTSTGFNALLDGAWRGHMVSTSDPAQRLNGSVRMNLAQSNAGQLSGTVTVSDPATQCWVGGAINEEASFITGARVVIEFADSGGANVVFDGNATDDAIDALYTSEAGPCGANSGTVQLNRA